MPKDLAAFFYPKSVAVVGASRSSEKVGSIVLKNIIDSKFRGKVYPVNPNADKIAGQKCYKDVGSLPENVDLVIVAVPAAIVLEILKQVGEKGIKNTIVLAAGFKEVGEEGVKREKDLVDVAKKYELNLLGPNCLGFVNNALPINATFGQSVSELGNLRFISQSGAIAAALFDWSELTTMGFKEFVTLGNKSDINENDVLQYFHDDSQNSLHPHSKDGLSSVSPIGLYLESISDGCEFLRITNEITKKDPILMIKPGKTKAAAKAMQSHTGAIAGEDDVLDAVLEQVGVIRCHTLEDFFDLSRAFAWEEVPKGPNVAIVSNAGGPGVISADAVVCEGLKLAEFNDETKKELTEALPRSASIINPVDVLGDALADRFAKALEVVLQTDEVDSIVVILTPQIMTQIDKTAENIGALSKKYNKPIFCSFIGGKLVAEGEKKLNEYKIPSFRYPERAIFAIGTMERFRMHKEKAKPLINCKRTVLHPKEGVIRSVVQRAVNEKQKTLDNLAVDEIFSTVEITTPATQKAANLNEAAKFVKENGWPVVLKLSSPGLLHKKEVGGIALDIMNDKQLDEGWHKLERKIEQLDDEIKKHVSFQIQKEVLGGVEVIIGVKNDPTFGPVLLFGAGGSFAELIDDKNIHLLPLELPQAKELVKQSKVYSILKDNDGDPPYALDKLYDLIVRVGKLAELMPEASDIEVNPAIVNINDAWAVDGKVIIKQGEKKKPIATKLKIARTLEHTVLATQFHFFMFESEEPLEFEPGQYVSVKVASDAIRAYSIATRNGTAKFGLLVDTRPGGVGSKFFEALSVGDKITYLGPFGVFTLNDDDGSEHLLFLATGSGIAPIRCMIEDLLIEQKVTKPITFYFGLTSPEEIFWKDHFEKLSKEYSNFEFDMALFKPDDTWKGNKGYITDIVRNKFPDTGKFSVYLCGHRAMIAEATDLMLERGCPKERIYQERFV